MANFQRTPGDKTTRLNKDAATLILVLDESTKIDVAGMGAYGLPLAVDAADPVVVNVSEDPVAVNNKTSLSTYRITGMRSGTTQIAARALTQSFVDPASRRLAWNTATTFATLQVTVFGVEYRQAGGTWGNLVYGSTNPKWKHVKWTSMAEAGCGPTSLAMVLDYLERLSPMAPRGPVSFSGVSPARTMEYSSRYGRAADKKGVPQGTSGQVMMDHISVYRPQYMSRPVLSLDDAKTLLRQSKPIIFLATKSVTTWKYDKHGNRVEQAWPGHFMVVLGSRAKAIRPGLPTPRPSRESSLALPSSRNVRCGPWRPGRRLRRWGALSRLLAPDQDSPRSTPTHRPSRLERAIAWMVRSMTRPASKSMVRAGRPRMRFRSSWASTILRSLKPI